jgi:RND family efflux transporter MFP subunit
MNLDKMPKKSKWGGRIVFCVLLIIVAGTLLYFRENLSERITKVLASTSDKEPIPVAKLERQPFSLTVSATGEIIGLETTLVSTPNTSAGQLTIAWMAAEGSFVQAGDPIVRYDSTSAQLNLEQRQNSLEQNRENTSITNRQQITDEKNRKIDLQIAEEDFNYSIKTMAQDETIYSRWEIITAAADERYSRENLEVLKNRVRTQQRADRSRQQMQTIQRNQLQTEVARYEQTLNSLELFAPVGGMIWYYRDRGQEPQIGNNSSPGQNVIEIINLDAMQAKINILERDGGYLEKDLPVNIRLDAVPDKVYHGVIRSVSSVAQSLTRNSPLRYFTAEVTISDAGGDLKLIRPGMYLRGDIVLHEYDSCFIVPSGAVTNRELQNDSVVFIKNGDRFETRVVETGLSSHGEAVILSGVEEGEIVALVNPEGTRKLSLPDFNLAPTTAQPKGKVMMMGGPGGGGFPGGGFPGGGGGMGGGGMGGGGRGR